MDFIIAKVSIEREESFTNATKWCYKKDAKVFKPSGLMRIEEIVGDSVFVETDTTEHFFKLSIEGLMPVKIGLKTSDDGEFIPIKDDLLYNHFKVGQLTSSSIVVTNEDFSILQSSISFDDMLSKLLDRYEDMQTAKVQFGAIMYDLYKV